MIFSTTIHVFLDDQKVKQEAKNQLLLKEKVNFSSYRKMEDHLPEKSTKNKVSLSAVALTIKRHLGNGVEL